MRSKNITLAYLRYVDILAWRIEILEALAQSGTIAGASRVLQISRSTLRRWITLDPLLRKWRSDPSEWAAELRKLKTAD